ncbi:MAG: ester cyclase [Acidimicrobiia bacterium]
MSPTPDLGAIADEHMRCEFALKSAERTMETMTENPYLNHVPTATGAAGHDAVLAFYRDLFIPSWPDDAGITPVTRTIGGERLVDEFVVHFTHTTRMEFMLPGVEPSGRRVELPHVVIFGFEDDKIAYERIYWDQASLLAQVGALDTATVPALGAEEARNVLDPDAPANEIMGRFGPTP